jgi:hypothetical protein
MALNQVAVGYAVLGLFTPVMAGHIPGTPDGLAPLVWQGPVGERTDAPGTLSGSLSDPTPTAKPLVAVAFFKQAGLPSAASPRFARWR